VVVPDDCCYLRIAEDRDEPRSLVSMAPDRRLLHLGERAGLVENRARNHQLAHVVDSGGRT
jgi:hypothetical protein